ncbi:MAG TPA: hypothetical protein VI321_06985 [Burkholderiales bacterium]
MRHAWMVSLSALLVSLSAHAAQPVPDPRLEQSYNTFVVPNIQRSVEFERTLPQPARRARPAVNEQNMKQMGDGLYVERSLLPRGGADDEPGVIRVFPGSSTGASTPRRP